MRAAYFIEDLMEKETNIDKRIRLFRESGVDWIDLFSELRIEACLFSEVVDKSNIESKEWRNSVLRRIEKLSRFSEFISEYGDMVNQLEN